jgi:uncharacterized tellurite resistance protein B-like protein
MHMLLSLLGAIVTIVILFKRLADSGIDLAGLNPFSSSPSTASDDPEKQLFSLSDPLEVAALLATTTAKIDGDLSSEEKTMLLQLFQSEFHKNEQQASDLLISSVYLFADGREAIAMPDKIMHTSLQSFSPEKAQSLMRLLNAISQVDNINQAAKQAYVNKVEAIFEAHFNSSDSGSSASNVLH